MFSFLNLIFVITLLTSLNAVISKQVECPYEPGYDRCIDYHDRDSNVTLSSTENREIRKEMFCACDDLCLFYNDCCIDAKPVQRSQFTSIAKPQCSPVKNMIDKFLIVNECSKDWKNEHVKNLCEIKLNRNNSFLDTFSTKFNQLKSNSSSTYANEILVFSETTGILYKNIFCSICNDDFQQIIRFDYSIMCFDLEFGKKTENWTISFDEFLKKTFYEDSNWKIRLNNATGRCLLMNDLFKSYTNMLPMPFRKCYSTVGSCPETWKDNTVKEKCLKFQSGIYLGDKKYRNVYCKQCNNVTNVMTCYYKSNFQDYPPSFRRLLDINISEKSFLKRNSQNNCKLSDGKIYSTYDKKCIQFGCDESSQKINGQCIRSNSSRKRLQIVQPACETVNLISNQFKVINESYIYINNTGKLVNEFKTISNHSVRVCVDDFKKLTKKENFFEQLISFICLLSSIVCLTLHLIAYLLVQRLQNLPGKALMSLSLSLLSAHIFFLFINSPTTSRRNPACLIIAIGAQYFYLVSFFWMNVLAYDIWRLLGKLKRIKDIDVAKRFKLYSLYAWGVPLVIISLSIITDFAFPDHHFAPAYGLVSCWINQKNALLMFFIVPLFILLGINVNFFGLTIKALNEAKKLKNSLTRNQQEQISFKLHIKLSVIMGMTWMFGVLAVFYGHDWIWYPFIVLNGLQGVFIFFGFSFKRKVFDDVKTKISDVTSRSKSKSDTSVELNLRV